MFQDREDAGKRLAKALRATVGPDALVVGLPRGGVPVAAVVARALGLPLDVLLVRKVGAPWNPELAVGAVGEDGTLVLNIEILNEFEISREYVERAALAEVREMRRRSAVFCAGRPRIPVEGRTVVLVDDGLATGATMEAAIAVSRAAGATRIVVAVPVAPPQTVPRLATLADEVVCLLTPPSFLSVSQFYDHFPQVSDAEVVASLKKGSESPCRTR
ncbi:MAG: hypothetical protein FJX76_28145 [Armatimonadetes bacterium]|nr:hypothetical protein [Armatimonadota bacterium]